MVRGGDLFGDGVNIAARLQTLAKPGGVCISGATYDQVHKVLPMSFVDLGVQQVKNILEPIRAYQVDATSETREAASSSVAETESAPPCSLLACINSYQVGADVLSCPSIAIDNEGSGCGMIALGARVSEDGEGKLRFGGAPTCTIGHH
jgi:hypothetical protein